MPEIGLLLALPSASSNLTDVRGRQVRTAVPLTVSVATLQVAIRHVLGWRTEEEMRRIYAWRVVAAMADKHACGDRPIGEFICDAVRDEMLVGRHMEIAITVILAMARPLPALVVAPTSCPLPESLRYRHSQLRSHRASTAAG